jgi:hypothetical protein
MHAIELVTFTLKLFANENIEVREPQISFLES